MLMLDISGAADRASRNATIVGTRTLAPTQVPVELAELKKHARVDEDLTADDELLQSFLDAALEHIEEYTGMALCTQKWEFRMDAFPFGGTAIYVPRPPLISIDEISYVDINGVTQIVDPTTYNVDTVSWPARVAPKYGVIWPPTVWMPSTWTMNGVKIKATCGFGAPENVPAPLKLAIKLLAAKWDRFRLADELAIGGVMISVPGVKQMLAKYVIRMTG